MLNKIIGIFGLSTISVINTMSMEDKFIAETLSRPPLVVEDKEHKIEMFNYEDPAINLQKIIDEKMRYPYRNAYALELRQNYKIVLDDHKRKQMPEKASEQTF